MKRSICTYPVIPVRSAPSERAEMVTQILFGEMFDVLEIEGRWASIRTVADDYPGWIDAKLVEEIDEAEIDVWSKGNEYVTHRPFGDWVIDGENILTGETNREFPYGMIPVHIPMGSTINDCAIFPCKPPMFDSVINNTCYTDFVGKEISERRPDSPVECAMRLLGAPYLWGGRTAMGIDCSGLVQLAFKVCYVQLPRDASQMVSLGSFVSIGEQRENDIAFFANENGNICHVGLCMDGGRIIHASGSVRIDTLDSEGIYNKNRGTHTHKLACIKRLWSEQLKGQIRLHEPPAAAQLITITHHNR